MEFNFEVQCTKAGMKLVAWTPQLAATGQLVVGDDVFVKMNGAHKHKVLLPMPAAFLFHCSKGSSMCIAQHSPNARLPKQAEQACLVETHKHRGQASL